MQTIAPAASAPAGSSLPPPRRRLSRRRQALLILAALLVLLALVVAYQLSGFGRPTGERAYLATITPLPGTVIAAQQLLEDTSADYLAGRISRNAARSIIFNARAALVSVHGIVAQATPPAERAVDRERFLSASATSVAAVDRIDAGLAERNQQRVQQSVAQLRRSRSAVEEAALDLLGR